MLAILGTIGLVIAFIAIGLWVDRHVSILPRPEELALDPAEERQRKSLRGEHEPGAAPESAITATAAELERLVRRQRHCRRRMEREPDDVVRYGDRMLTVLRFHCAACGARARVYVAPG